MEEKKEPWLNYLATTTVVFAVFATLSTFKAGGFSTLAVLSQNQASDQWGYYQAKSIKGYLYEIQKEKISMEMKTSAGPLKSGYEGLILRYEEKLKKYESEKAAIMKDAQALEERREDARSHSKRFGVAVIFLQMAIVFSSISALLKKKILWLASIALGAWGILKFIDGIWTFMPF
jgi:hypothetical protein